MHAPSLQYKLYVRDDDERVHACHFLHQIGYEKKKCMPAHVRHHQQKYLSTPTATTKKLHNFLLSSQRKGNEWGTVYHHE